MQIVINAQTGEIGIDLYTTTPIQTTAGGSLVTVTLHVQNAAPPGANVLSVANQVNPTGLHIFRTEVSDDMGALVLEVAS